MFLAVLAGFIRFLDIMWKKKVTQGHTDTKNYT